jgi:hypothetical protein
LKEAVDATMNGHGGRRREERRRRGDEDEEEDHQVLKVLEHCYGYCA